MVSSIITYELNSQSTYISSHQGSNIESSCGLQFSIINDELAEDLALANAIESWKTGEYVDLANFLSELKNENSDR